MQEIKAYMVDGSDRIFRTKEDAKKAESDIIASSLMSYCYSSEFDQEEKDSLVSIINILIKNNITSKKELIKLKESL